MAVCAVRRGGAATNALLCLACTAVLCDTYSTAPRQGYFAISGATMPPPKPQTKQKGKRDHGSIEGSRDNPEEQDEDARDEEVVGGSEPRRRVSRLASGPKN